MELEAGKDYLRTVEDIEIGLIGAVRAFIISTMLLVFPSPCGPETKTTEGLRSSSVG